MNELLESDRVVSQPARVDINGTQFTATVVATPELYQLPDGKAMIRLRVVITGEPAGRDGNVKEIKVPIVMYGARAEEVCRQVGIGSWIAVKGSLDYKIWERANGPRGELRVLASLIVPIAPALDRDACAFPSATPPTLPSATPPSQAPVGEPPDSITEQVLEEFGLRPTP